MKRFVVVRWLPALILPVSAWAAEGALTEQAQPSQAQIQPQAQPDLETRVGKMEAMVQSSAAFNLLKELEALKAEVARLSGQAEMQQHQLEVLSKRQSDLYIDLDKRLEDLNKQVKSAAPAAVTPGPAVAVSTAEATAATVTTATPPAASTTAKQDPLAESKAYEDALEQFKAGDYEKAIAGFGDFLKSYPQSTLAANALYWTGYAYYARKDYKNALAQQMKLVSTYPQNPKVPDALLNIANNQLELNDTASAKKNLEEIVAKYPGTNAAAIAAKRLSLIK
jgi:tol-pal system protein YbgF